MYLILSRAGDKPRTPAAQEVRRESPVLGFILLILAGLSVVGGTQLLDIKRVVAESMTETENYCNAVAAPGL